MKPQVLIPDLDHTEELDVFEEQLQGTVAIWETVVREAAQDGDDEELEGANTAHDEAIEALAEYRKDPGGPTVTLGFLPPSKKTELQTRMGIHRENGTPEIDKRLASLDVVREYVRWGVKGDSLEHGIQWETEEYRGRKYKVCPDAVLDLYEFNGWLNVLFGAVLAFNSLDAEKKRASSRNAGTTPGPSTAKPAGSSPG
jgi:hypothetical protein